MTWKLPACCLEHSIHLAEFCANEDDGDDADGDRDTAGGVTDDAGGDDGSGAGGVVIMLIEVYPPYPPRQEMDPSYKV